MDFSERSRVEDQLREELRQARGCYECAMRQFDVAVREAHQLGLTHPDGSHSMHKAASQYNYSLNRYSEALKRFSLFILEGIRPD